MLFQFKSRLRARPFEVLIDCEGAHLSFMGTVDQTWRMSGTQRGGWLNSRVWTRDSLASFISGFCGHKPGLKQSLRSSVIVHTALVRNTNARSKLKKRELDKDLLKRRFKWSQTIAQVCVTNIQYQLGFGVFPCTLSPVYSNLEIVQTEKQYSYLPFSYW